MRKKKIFYKIFNLFLLLALASTPFTSLAQSNEGESQWEGSEKGEVLGWRDASSSLSRKIDDLSNKRIIDLSLPILFGLTPDNLTKNFGDLRSGGRKHEGLDIMAPKRALIVTPTEAVVIRTGVGESAGKYVYTANPGGETFAYMHLDEIADINEGDVLEKGDLIGYVGNTGNASGGATHLHFEIQDEGDPTDPYPRFTRVFILADKIKYLEEIIDQADNENELIKSVVTLYRKELLLAPTLGIALPTSITEVLITQVAVEVSTVVRTLRLGSTGEDVKALQALLGLVADGSFGPKTKAAVVAFQMSKGLIADGVFGSTTRLALFGKGAFPPGCTSTTLFSSTTGIKCSL